MRILFEQIENNTRGYHGIVLEEDEFKRNLSGPVRNNLLDVETRDAKIAELTGLMETGFQSSDRLLADIQALQNAHPSDLRDWHIGEALAEIVLEGNFQCRFHWNELRDARNPKGNKTGADLVGFIEIDGSILFLFGEVKTSSEIANRPPQVMTNAEGIESQLMDLYSDRAKRQILISYLMNKTRLLPAGNIFKSDYDVAIRSYYGTAELYQLIGVLIRDVEHDHRDVSVSYNKLSETILNPLGLKLLAMYTPIKKEDWADIVKGAI